MTIPTSTARNDYVGSGITGPYPVTFKFFEDADLRVTVDGVEKTLTTHYTLTGANVQAGGALTFVTAVDADALIAIEPRGAFDQETDIRNEGGNLRVSIEDRFDRLCRDDQVLKNLADRSLKIRTNDASFVDPTLPERVAGSLIGFNDSGTGFTTRSASLLAADAAITSTGSTTARWISDRFADVVNVKDFGAVADGVTDDTTAINLAIASDSNVIDGGNREYLVSSLILASHKTLQNIRLKVKANSGVSALAPCVKIGDDVTPITDVTLVNVIINGNRQNLTNINLAAGEDGGMHGIRIGGLATDIRVINCEANYCGTAGLALHDTSAGAAATYPIKRIYIENFVAEWNREHGMFADSVDGLFVRGAILSNNGQTLTGALPDTDGRTGAKVGGILFGAGFDLETYVGAASSYIKNVQFVNVICKGNAQGALIYIPSVVSAVAEIPCQGVHLIDCDLEKSTLGVYVYALRIAGNTPSGAKYGVDGVTISGRLNGHIDANLTKGVSFTSGWSEADATFLYKALINNSVDWSITAPGNTKSVLVQTFSSLGVAADTGAGSWAPVVDQAVISNGVHMLVIDANITGGTIAGGNMSWTLTMPTGMEIVSATIAAYNTGTAKTTPAHVAHLTSTTLRVFVTPTDDTLSIQLRVQVMP